jgi:hypothetical protein
MSSGTSVFSSILSAFSPARLAMVGQQVKLAINSRNIGLASAAGLATLGLDITDLFKNTRLGIFIIFVVFLVICLYLIYRISCECMQQSDASSEVSSGHSKPIALLVSSGGFLASLGVLVLGLVVPGTQGSTLLALLETSKKMQGDVGFISDRFLEAELTNRLQIRFEDDPGAGSEAFRARLIWPVIDEIEVEDCSIDERAVENDYYEIRMASCESLLISITAVKEGQSTQDRSQIFLESGQILGQNAPRANVELNDGRSLSIPLMAVSLEVINRLQRRMTQANRQSLETIKAEREERNRQREIERTHQAIVGQFSCSVLGCSSGGRSGRELCAEQAERLTIGRTPGDFEVEIDLGDNCTDTGRGYLELDHKAHCLAVPESMAPLNPGEDLHFAVHYPDKEPFSFTRKVDALNRSVQSQINESGWTELQPLPPDDSERQPLAIAGLNRHHGYSGDKYSVWLAVGMCRFGRVDSASFIGGKILINPDGRGLLPVEGSYQDGVIEIEEPTGEVLELGFETESGSRYGPYRYRFNAEDLIRNAASAVAGRPKLACWREYRNQQNQLSCGIDRSVEAHLHWMDVNAVRIGSTPGDWEIVEILDVSARDVADMERNSEHGQFWGTNFSFSPPEQWQELFYEITLRDGSILEPERLALKR